MKGREVNDEELERRAQLRKEYGDLHDEMIAILFRLDPEGINFEVNTDEYAPEVRTILPRLKEATTPAELQRIIEEEFVRWFEEPSATPDEFRQIADEIFAAAVQHGFIAGPSE